MTEEKNTTEENSSVEESDISTSIFALRTTANREDQVLDFISSNVKKKKIPVYSGLQGLQRCLWFFCLVCRILPEHLTTKYLHLLLYGFYSLLIFAIHRDEFLL